MRFLFALLGISFAAATTSSISSIAAQPPGTKESQTTKATYMIAGLHCPPCTKTVESSLARIRGVHSAKVDWKTKMAQIEFDEKLVPAQTLAQQIAATPHMMGGEMKYDGWLALKVPDIRDEAAAKTAKAALASVKGVKQVAVYPKLQTVGVQFDRAGRVTSGELIKKLDEAGLKAATAFTAQPGRGSQSQTSTPPNRFRAEVAQLDPHAGMQMDHSQMNMPDQAAGSTNHGAMDHGAKNDAAMDRMMCGCSMCMHMMGMSGMNGMSMNGTKAGMSRGMPATVRGYSGGSSGRGCGC